MSLTPRDLSSQTGPGSEEQEISIQVNGKLRDKVMISPKLSRFEIETLVLRRPKVVAALQDRQQIKVIYGAKLVNIVAR